MISVSQITLEALQQGTYKEEFPLLYTQQDVIEENDWHTGHSVFDHSMKVVSNLLSFIEKASEKIVSELNGKVEKVTRKEVLFLAACFHDIGKKDTLVKQGGKTSCHGHEAKGAELVVSLLEKIDLGQNDKALIFEIIKHHGHMHQIVDPSNSGRDAQFKEFKEGSPHLFLLLLLLGYADTLGSNLENTQADEYHARISFYEKVLGEY